MQQQYCSGCGGPNWLLKKTYVEEGKRFRVFACGTCGKEITLQAGKFTSKGVVQVWVNEGLSSNAPVKSHP